MKGKRRYIVIALGIIAMVSLMVGCVPEVTPTPPPPPPPTPTPPEEELWTPESIVKLPEGTTKPWKEGEIIIAFCSDITGAIAAEQCHRTPAQHIFIDYLNEEWGGIDGHPIKVLWEDTEYNPAKIMTAYKRFIAAGAKMIVTDGSVGGTATKALAPIDDIVVTNGGGALDNYYPAGRVFSTCPNYARSFVSWMEWVKEDWAAAGHTGTPKVGTMQWDNAFGRAILPQGYVWAAKNDVDIVGSEFIPLKPLDVTTQLLALKGKDAQYIYVNCITWAGATALNDAKKLGMIPGVKFGGVNWCFKPSMIELAGDNFEGFISPTAFPANWDIPGMVTPELERIWEKYTPRYAIDKPEFRSQDWLSGWGETAILCLGCYNAVKKVGYENLTGGAIFDGIKQLNVQYPGVPKQTLNMTQYPEDRESCDTIMLWEWTKEKGFQPVTDWFKMKELPMPKEGDPYY